MSKFFFRGEDKSGEGLEDTASFFLPIQVTSFNFIGILKLDDRPFKNLNNNPFGLYLGNTLIKSIDDFKKGDDNKYSFNFKNLMNGAYSLRFNIHGDDRDYSIKASISAVPEAQTSMMMMLGLGVLSVMVARRQQA